MFCGTGRLALWLALDGGVNGALKSRPAIRLELHIRYLFRLILAMTNPPSASAAHSPDEEQSSEKLLLSMGHVMSAWQGIEHAVFDIFRHFFEPDHFDVAATTFFAVQAFETRIQMVDALMTQFARKEQCEKWGCIHKKIRKKSKQRNIAAHGLFAFFGVPPKRKAVLSRSIYDIARFPDTPSIQDFTNANALLDAAAAFSNMTKEIYDFLEELKQDATLLPKLRARPQRVEENDRKHPLTVRIPPKS
jgi:hypothetical protein